MPILNEIQQMKMQGIPDSEIASSLKDKGYSPLEISQGIEQSKIKEVINKDTSPDDAPPVSQDQMQPSIVEDGTNEAQEEFAEYPAYPSASEEVTEETPQYEYSQAQYQQNPEVIAEIAEQLIVERTEPLKNSIQALNEMKQKTEKTLASLDERLKRMENILDTLQESIITRTGKYFEDITEIKKEMNMMQDVFSRSPNKVKVEKQ